MATQVKFISDPVVRRVLTWDRLLPAVRRSLEAFSRGPRHPQGAVQPLRTSVSVEEHQGTMLVMPGLMPGEGGSAGALATKIVSLFPGNAAKGLSTHHALVVLMEPGTGAPLAILEGEAITELRTAAASAAATLELVREKPGEVTPFVCCQVRIWARKPEAAEALVLQLQAEGICAEPSTTVQEACKYTFEMNNSMVC
ncbi:ketimine reductase mu-crystallin-like [Penaeus chinensis]|uniref:ketimine reductase mu-crystallin-like n=1 Tax=Penaeus chinensis TaxID=139456 RepID=UPI001FB7BEB3|nr:ketimine reductase mu-crystallin-like [Penaeus chinensis]